MITASFLAGLPSATTTVWATGADKFGDASPILKNRLSNPLASAQSEAGYTPLNGLTAPSQIFDRGRAQTNPGNFKHALH
jgi:hypothetical protein